MARMTPLPLEAVSFCVTSSEELHFACPAIHDFLENCEDEDVDPVLRDVAKEAAERCDILMSNAVYICQLPVTEANKRHAEEEVRGQTSLLPKFDVSSDAVSTNSVLLICSAVATEDE